MIRRVSRAAKQSRSNPRASGDDPAAAAAADGAETTCPMTARRGRASYLGARSAGHCDPGALSTALILAAAVRAAGAEMG